MTKEFLAALLNGREHRKFDLTKDEAEHAKEAGLVAVFGYSDDNLEFRGAIRDEIGAYEGVTAVLYKGSKRYDAITDESEAIRDLGLDSDLEAALVARRKGHKVEAVWAPKEIDATWLIRTHLPHATFDIMEDGELFCRGLVLDVADLK